MKSPPLGGMCNPKVRLGPVANDFAVWFERWGYTSLAQQLDAFDPYRNRLEDTRVYLQELIAMGLRRPPEGVHDDCSISDDCAYGCPHGH